MDQRRVIEWLSSPKAYEPEPPEVVVRQTHISVVFLAGDLAYKIKKDVRFGFVDYGTLERRRYFCEEEVRLNRRLAEGVYLGVVPITSGPSGVRVDGDGEVVEWAVRMRRLPDEATLQSILERGMLGEGQVGEVGRRIAAFHARAPRNEQTAACGRFARVARLVRDNLEAADWQVGAMVQPRLFERLRQRFEQVLRELEPLIEERADRGVPCDGHGDLRLDHIYLFPENRPPADLRIVDCVEFDPELRFADPVSDLAFLLMELIARGRRDLAAACREAYLSAARDPSGRRLIPLYIAYRAVVRAKVAGLKAVAPETPEEDRQTARAKATARWLLAAAELETPRRRPCLVLIGGLPGTGKSTLARALGATADFTVIRSDEVRKVLSGQASLPEKDQGIYSEDWNDRTYNTCLDRAERILLEGGRVIVDATFRREPRRLQFLKRARDLGVPALALICEADSRVVRDRLNRRRGDLSEADWSVHEQAAAEWDPPGPETQRDWRRVDTSGSSDHSLALALRLLEENQLWTRSDSATG